MLDTTWFPFDDIDYLGHPDTEYLSTARSILNNGEERADRTGTGTISLFAPPRMKFDLTQGFPLLTTKKLHINSIVHELLWFLKGDTNLDYLIKNNVRIWNADAYRWYKQNGGEFNEAEFLHRLTEQEGFDVDLGPIYPKQWRAWDTNSWKISNDGEAPRIKTVDQIKELIKGLKENPTSRRHIVNAWNVGQLNQMALPPCHVFFQVYIHNDGGLSLQMYQRSADWFLGVPFNIASYSLLTCLLAHVTGHYPKEFIHVVGDGHIYKNHIPQMKLQMTREPKKLPKLWLNPEVKDIDDFTFEDILFTGYDPLPLIKGSVSVG